MQLLELLVDRGGDVNARNAQGQTPLQLITASRDQLAKVQAMMKSMGVKLPGLADDLSNVTLPAEGWDACELLLEARGAQ